MDTILWKKILSCSSMIKISFSIYGSILCKANIFWEFDVLTVDWIQFSNIASYN